MSENSQKIKIVFMGTPLFAATILKSLVLSKHNIVDVYTKPDMKVGKNQEIKKSAVRITAEEAKLIVETPQKLDEEVIKKIESLKPDLIIVAAYGRILPKKILAIPRLGAINVHPSLLPKFRGPSPIQNTLLLGEKETGTTIILMDEGVDTGDILTQKKTTVGNEETYLELSARLADLSSELLIETIPLWVEQKITPQTQDNTHTLICQLIERADGKINWDDEARNIYNRYRAFTPWPGIYTFWEKNGINFRLKLSKISMGEENPEGHHLGEVFFFNDKTAVKTADGIIFLEEIQMEGKNKMNIDEFHRGMPNFVGSILK
jgi:methionyl-tRNA formyltransferase